MGVASSHRARSLRGLGAGVSPPFGRPSVATKRPGSPDHPSCARRVESQRGCFAGRCRKPLSERPDDLLRDPVFGDGSTQKVVVPLGDHDQAGSRRSVSDSCRLLPADSCGCPNSSPWPHLARRGTETTESISPFSNSHNHLVPGSSPGGPTTLVLCFDAIYSVRSQCDTAPWASTGVSRSSSGSFDR